MFERWQQYRDEKNEVNDNLGDLLSDKPLSQKQAAREARLVKRYNELYALMYDLQDEFSEEDWQAYEVEQEQIRESERQAWLIKDRYGDPNPPSGIADWWTGQR